MEQLLSQYGFTVDEIKDFISNALVVKCTKRTILLRENDIPRFFYCATKGLFRAGYTDKKGNDITRAFFSPETYPFVVSYGNFITQTPSLSFLEALEDGELLSWHFEYIKKLEEADIKWLRFIKKQLDNVVLLYDIKEWRRYMLSPEEQYTVFLENSPSLAQRIPQHYIASYIGVTPEALSRIRTRQHTKKITNKSGN
jgi:CRP-like cAMP-binding protein